MSRELRRKYDAMPEPTSSEEWRAQRKAFLAEYEKEKKETDWETIKACCGCIFFLVLVAIGIMAQMSTW